MLRRSLASSSTPPTLAPEVYAAALAGKQQQVLKYLRKGGQINAHCTTKLGFTLLHAAAGNGHLSLAEVLLKRGASVDKNSHARGHTPLMTAAQLGHPAMASCC